MKNQSPPAFYELLERPVKSIPKYNVVCVNKDGTREELLIDSYSYGRALAQGEHSAEIVGVKLHNKTSHSSLRINDEN